MHLVFIDESGRSQEYYYMGALIMDEVTAHTIESSLDGLGKMIARQVPRFNASTELHAFDMFHGQREWSSVPVPLRVRACRIAVQNIRESGARFVFRGVDIAALNRKYVNPFEPHALALSQTLESVQRFMDGESRSGQHALVLADEHHTAPDSRTRFNSMKSGPVKGHTKRPLTCLLDTVYFGPSHHSRLLQAADIATFFTNRHSHITEKHPAARKAMSDIAENLLAMTEYSYVWRP